MIAEERKVVTMARLGNKKRDSILRAGEQLFNQYGLGKTTMEDIARAAHVAKGTLYKYFPSKEDVFSSVVQHEGNILVKSMMEAVEKENAPIDKIRALITAKTKMMKELANFYRVTREDAHRIWPYLESTRKGFFEKEAKILEDILLEGKISGLFRIEDPAKAARSMVAALKGLEIEWILENSPDGEMADIEMIMDVVAWGIMAPAQEPSHQA